MFTNFNPCPMAVTLLILAASLVSAAEPVPAPKVAGAWIGEWGEFNPAKATEIDPTKCKQLDCVVVAQDGVWSATFKGECGRPYKYTITMSGRQSGKVVLFQGSTDLGAEDGGVHDWIGRASDDEFIGFYSSANHTGCFRLHREPNAEQAVKTP